MNDDVSASTPAVVVLRMPTASGPIESTDKAPIITVSTPCHQSRTYVHRCSAGRRVFGPRTAIDANATETRRPIAIATTRVYVPAYTTIYRQAGIHSTRLLSASS
uniref:Uncharacterized protein n=1 Tax=Plectus sambesii TaxID=2011161 RepID=A0A914USR5_9BILA